MKREKPIGLYVHVPFCERKCLYCDFLSFTAGDDEKKMYVDLLVDELGQWDRVLSGGMAGSSGYKIQTVFLGGGTPTCLSAGELVKIGDAIRGMKIFGGREDKSHIGGGMYDYCPDNGREDKIATAASRQSKCQETAVEYTVEMNPKTLLKQHIGAFKHMGVNRISIGLQSAQDDELKVLGRIHDWEGFRRCYTELRESGFDNINIDLMSAIPGQTYESYKDTLERLIKLKPEHISAYSLIVEAGTPFAAMREAGELFLPDEDEDREMYALTKEMLSKCGLHRYEISNYSLHGKECRHNHAYWSGIPYLGAGLGSSSYIYGKRWQNPVSMEEYRRLVLDGAIVENTMEKASVLGINEQMEEYMFLGLRKTEGISVDGFLKEFGVSLNSVYGDVINKLFGQGLLSQSGNNVYLTEHGIDVSNTVLSEFLLD